MGVAGTRVTSAVRRRISALNADVARAAAARETDLRKYAPEHHYRQCVGRGARDAHVCASMVPHCRARRARWASAVPIARAL